MNIRFIGFALFMAISHGLGHPTKDYSSCELPINVKEEIQGYRPIVNRIIKSIVDGEFKGDTYKSLSGFIDKFGPRMAGGLNLEYSIDYLIKHFNDLGLKNAYTEDAIVPHWVRGKEKATLLSPRSKNLQILGLGTTIGTPKGGITADVVVVESFEELEAIPNENIRGKIVVYAEKWLGSYKKTVAYRSGSVQAAKKGAVASLIRSVTQFSIASPHTGSQYYENGVRKIPTACITVEDAEFLLRTYRKGEAIKIHLEMEDHTFANTISRNTFVELPGSEKKNTSVVVVSGHLDSWDVGFGAMDDAGGCWVSWKSVEYLTKLGLTPKRTIRAALWTAEEEGTWGAKHYKNTHLRKEKEEFNFFMESDTGTFDPIGFDFSGTPGAMCIFKEVLSLMEPLNATTFATPMGGGPDVSLWVNRGFPGASLLNANDRYFWFHHSRGDSMIIEDPKSLDKATALFAATAYVIADLKDDMPKIVTN